MEPRRGSAAGPFLPGLGTLCPKEGVLRNSAESDKEKSRRGLVSLCGTFLCRYPVVMYQDALVSSSFFTDVAKFGVIGVLSYLAIFSQNRIRIAAAWARVAEPAGARVVLVVPFISPALTAHVIGSRA